MQAPPTQDGGWMKLGPAGSPPEGRARSLPVQTPPDHGRHEPGMVHRRVLRHTTGRRARTGPRARHVVERALGVTGGHAGTGVRRPGAAAVGGDQRLVLHRGVGYVIAHRLAPLRRRARDAVESEGGILGPSGLHRVGGRCHGPRGPGPAPRRQHDGVVVGVGRDVLADGEAGALGRAGHVVEVLVRGGEPCGYGGPGRRPGAAGQRHD